MMKLENVHQDKEMIKQQDIRLLDYQYLKIVINK